jgi:hypothetical protein
MEEHTQHHTFPRINHLTILVFEINGTIEIEMQERTNHAGKKRKIRMGRRLKALEDEKPYWTPLDIKGLREKRS